MKITKTDLRKIIEEELNSSLKEGPLAAFKGGASKLRQYAKHGATAKKLGQLTPRERNVQNVLNQILDVMAQPGEQASGRLQTLVQRALEALESTSEMEPGADAGGPPEATARTSVPSGKGTSVRPSTPGIPGVGPGGGPPRRPQGFEESLDEDALVAEIIKRLGGK